MNLPRLISVAQETFENCTDLLIRKNSDYSKDADVHSNFTELAGLCTFFDIDVRTPVGCLQFFILMKTHRQFKLIRDGKTPSNESLLDTSVDKINYEILLNALLSERNS